MDKRHLKLIKDLCEVNQDLLEKSLNFELTPNQIEDFTNKTNAILVAIGLDNKLMRELELKGT